MKAPGLSGWDGTVVVVCPAKDKQCAKFWDGVVWECYIARDGFGEWIYGVVKVGKKVVEMFLVTGAVSLPYFQGLS